MTPLQIMASKLGIDEAEALTELQLNGVVADECVTLADVAGADQDKAALWLKMTKGD